MITRDFSVISIDVTGVSLSLSLSLSLYYYYYYYYYYSQKSLTHNIESASALPIIDRFRSGGEHSRTGGEHSPARAHTSTRLRTFSLPSLFCLGLGATVCVEGMFPACSCVCDRSDKRRKDTKKSEFDKEKTNRRAISTVNGCLVADKLSFLRSKYEVVRLCT